MTIDPKGPKNTNLLELQKLAEGAKILYIEDEEGVRNEVSEILSNIFTRVVTAQSGRQGLEYFQDEDFLVVITDINMPEMNGIDVIQEIKKFKPQQSFIVTSAYSDSKYLLPLINLGVGSFLLKPIKLDSLILLLNKELAYCRSKELEKQYQLKLEKEVRMRTKEVVEAQAQIFELQAAKDNMLALISHELRTPLNGILGFSELIRPFVKEQEALDFLSHIEESAKRLERSTQKALDFSSIATAHRTLSIENYPLEKMIKAAWEQVHNRQNIQMEMTVQNIFLHTDWDLAVEAFRNILENCVKYGGKGVKIEACVEGTWQIVKIIDSGSGFPAYTIEQGLKPFSSGNIMHHSEGMGLGLAVDDVIMLTLGGKISLANVVQGGAEVKLYFPQR